jgi:hypothetical protein
MIKPIKVLVLLQVVLLLELKICQGATIPKWVNQRPRMPGYYVGIGMSKKGVEDYQTRAKSDALLDLSQEISVAVSGTFVQNIVEKTGLSEAMVRSEIKLSSKAHISEHQRVDQWEDDDVYWVYYRLSKRRYRQIRDHNRSTASKLAADMFKRALSADDDHKIVSALRFDYEALQQLSDYLGESIEADINGRTLLLGNAIYAHLQDLMTAIRLSSGRPALPVLVGATHSEQVAVIANAATDDQKQVGIAKLPLTFSFPWRSKHATRYTDQSGRAVCELGSVPAAENGLAVAVSIDINTLFPEANIILEALLKRVSQPQLTIGLLAVADRQEYLWRHEFQGCKVTVLAAYQVNGKAEPWPKLYDEMIQHLKRIGANIISPPTTLFAEKIIELASQPEKVSQFKAFETTEVIIIVTAQGKLNQRENLKNPLGQDVQFAGKFSNIVQRESALAFSDRYQAMTGFNPMGEIMCMEVTALNVFKRWKRRYLEHLDQN